MGQVELNDPHMENGKSDRGQSEKVNKEGLNLEDLISEEENQRLSNVVDDILIVADLSLRGEEPQQI